jgi:MFS transporter, DHA2 family, methylenomycin A resistance protein
MQRRARATLAAATVGFAVIQLDVFVVNVGAKEVGAALGGGVAGLQWIVGIYTLMFAALILTAGTLGDRFGARRICSLGFVVFVVASTACGLAPDLAFLVAARAVQGIGAALLGASTLALIDHAFPRSTERGRALGIWAAGAATALSAGPVIGGVLIAAIGWRSIFFINLPIGAAGLFVTRRFAIETPVRRRRVDLPGQLTVVLALAALTTGLIESGTVGFADPLVLGAFALAVVTGAAFVLIESRARDAMLPLSLFRRKAFAGATVLGLIVNVPFYGLVFVFSLFFQRVQGGSALHAGIAFLPLTAAVLAADLAASRVARAIGTSRGILLGLSAMGAACLGLLFIQRTTPFAEIVAQQVLLGGGIGLVVPPMTNALLGSVEQSRSGIASGTLTTSRQTGSVLGIAVFGSLIAAGGHFIGGFHIALAISIALLATGVLLVRFTTFGARPGRCLKPPPAPTDLRMHGAPEAEDRTPNASRRRREVARSEPGPALRVVGAPHTRISVCRCPTPTSPSGLARIRTVSGPSVEQTIAKRKESNDGEWMDRYLYER